jgi:hypothetical protein
MTDFERLNAEILAGPDGPAKRFLKAYLEKKNGRNQAVPPLPTGGTGERNQGDEPDMLGQAPLGEPQGRDLEPGREAGDVPGVQAPAPAGPMKEWDLPMDPAED